MMTNGSVVLEPPAPVNVALGGLDEIRFLDPLLRELPPSAKAEIPSGCLVMLRGWFLLKDPPRRPSGVTAVIDGSRIASIPYGLQRPDVATMFGIASLVDSGYKGLIDLSLPVGPHALRICSAEGDPATRPALIDELRITIVESRRLFTGTEESDCIRSGVERLAALSGRHKIEGFTMRVPRGDIVVVSGWAADTTEVDSGSGDVFAVIDGEHYVPGIAGLPRAQTARVLNIPAASGFTVRFGTKDLRVGEHKVELAIMASRSKHYKTMQVCRLIVE